MTKKNKLIHTPEGVRDIYNGECRRKLAVQEKILHTLYLYGYEHIQTPSFLTGTTTCWCSGRI